MKGQATHDGFHLQTTLTDNQALSLDPCEQISNEIPPPPTPRCAAFLRQMCDHDSQRHNRVLHVCEAQVYEVSCVCFPAVGG